MISPNTQTVQPYATNIINIRGGREGAINYPVATGYTALLLDEENKMFFIKKNDASGAQVPLREFRFEEVIPANNNNSEDMSKYATKEDFNMLMAEIKKLQGHGNHRSNNYKQRRNNGNGSYYAKSDVR